ncbi:SDR family NAD(P)-dependent oxidoreductase [soil metagenome]
MGGALKNSSNPASYLGAIFLGCSSKTGQRSYRLFQNAMKRILVTGGAGFIGSYLCRTLSGQGWEVTALDNLSPQVHGTDPKIDLPKDVNFIRGDVCCEADLERALDGQEVVVHLAAETGTGQSMYELLRYEQVNVRGTALLMHTLLRQSAKSVKKVVVASSRAIYGEGANLCPIHGVVYPKPRALEDMAERRFEPRCPRCQAFCEPFPTDEDCPSSPTSYYGITKQAQEQTVLTLARSLGISAYALRYQNVYGPGQSLKNPYTGILAVFSNLARSNQTINVFEDGLESRDFVYVEDVVDATMRCIDRPGVFVDRFNVGSGERITVEQVARKVAAYFESSSTVEISGDFRQGDIRHNVADLTHVKETLGYRPRWSFTEGVSEFLRWASLHEQTESGFNRSMDELKARGLLFSVSAK